MTLSFRNATEADLGAIDQVFRASFCDTFGHLYSSEDLAAFLGQFTRHAWAEEFHDPRYAFRIAEVDGRPVGFVKLGPSDLPITPAGPAIELRQFYILGAWLGQGASQPLMDWAIAEGGHRGCEEMYLTVYVDNHRARRFYARNGFKDVGSYRFMVGSQADEDIIMVRRL